MTQHLLDFFLEHRYLQLPGFGRLNLMEAPARYDAARKLMMPPQKAFEWIPEVQVTDSLQPVIGYFSRVTGAPEEASYETLHALSSQIQQEISTHGFFALPGLGKWVNLDGAAAGFVPLADLDALQNPLPAERVVHAGTVHQMQVGDTQTDTGTMQQWLQDEKSITAVADRWWIAPLITGIAATTLIVCRLMGWL